jgi:hypothetical protein
MKRTLAVVACLVAVLGLAPAAALAQAPAPKVTIVGLFDQVTTAGRNIYDGNFARSSESEWYARTRFRPDFTFEVGRTKAVLGLEIDLSYGQMGANDGGFPGNVSGTNSGCKPGSNGCLDTNTDVGGMIEIKWVYTEFDLTGKDSLLPFIPVPTVARLGGQPYATLANYKIAYANGDFAGFSAITTFAPNLRLNLAYTQIEDQIATSNKGNLIPRSVRRGDDFAVIVSPEITPFKGLDIKPLYSYVYIQDSTSASTRRPIANAQGAIGVTGNENRHTVGVDARWRSGPFSLDPTFYYQFGNTTNREAAGTLTHGTINAFLADVQGGFQLGPLLLEARGIWSSGNEAKDDLRHKQRYYEPLNLDTGYYSGWAQILALGVDYFNGGGGTVQSMSTNVGYDRYGRRQLGFRATYSLTPQLAFYGIVSPTWTDEKVDTDTNIVRATAGATARTAPAATGASGDSRYIGTEADLGLTWRFAPNTVFDLVGGYLFAGSALDVTDASGKRDSQDGWSVTARVRLSF